MSVSIASSLSLSSFNPKTLSFCISKPTQVYILPISTSHNLQAKPVSFSLFASSLANKCSAGLLSSYVRNAVFSSEFEVDDAVSDRGERSSSPDLKLFVGNLSFNVDSAQLAGLFESAGNVEMVEVIYDKITGRSRGFGFVTMSTAAEVEAAAQQFDGYELDGRAIRVNSGPAPPKREESFSRSPRSSGRPSSGSSYGSGYGSGSSSGSGSSNRLYVGNLSWGVDDVALESLFNEQGKVLEARVIYDRDSGRSKGFGFVTYGSSQEVNNAIESLNGADVDGRQIRVSVAEAKPPRRQF